MNITERAKEWMDNEVDLYVLPHEHCVDASSIIRDLLAEVERLTDTLEAVIAPEWRDIGTLPKIDLETCRSKDVLGVWPDGSMMVVYLDVCKGWMESEESYPCVKLPTHWQPLPDPPEVGQ